MGKIANLFQKGFGFFREKPSAPRFTTPTSGLFRASLRSETSGGIGRKEWMVDEGAFLADYYRYIRQRVPMIANGISVWIDLSTSGSSVTLKNGSKLEQEQAVVILEALSYRCYEFDYEWGSGYQRLAELFYLSFYTNGRFAAEIVPYSDMSGIAYVAMVDPFSIRFRRGDDGKIALYQERIGIGGLKDEVLLPRDRVFYAALDPDTKSPMGCSLLDSVRWVLEIKERLIEDMAKASHNAGFPRIRVNLNPGTPIPGESPLAYVARVNADYDEAQKMFRDLAPEDNIISMGNLVVDYMSAAGGQDYQWSVNLARVEDEVTAGLRLFAWALAVNAGANKNWSEAQENLLMQRVHRGVQHGNRFLDWVRNTELRLMGSPVRASQEYRPLRDPGKLIGERALQWESQRVMQWVDRGFISKDDGARRLGLAGAFRQDEVLPSLPPLPNERGLVTGGKGVVQ